MSVLGKETRFRYFLDPLFLGCSFVYVMNRFIIKPRMPSSEIFFRGYLNDFLLIPCALPPLLFLHRIFSLRSANQPPTPREITIHLVFWSLFFEYLGPIFYRRATSDPWDIGAYWVGGFISWIVWNMVPRRQKRSTL